ncbi:MAG: tetratricopeptide repeat protein [Acidobacteriales bacterium]|nr:tetratricopeptide repeat protein [Terriglobales bacterium]
MRSSRNAFLFRIFLCASVVCMGTLVLRASLPPWIQNIEARTLLEEALFRMMDLPGGKVMVRRPPAEARAGLSARIQVEPKNAELYAMRAMSAEEALDFENAESDWKMYTLITADKAQGGMELADFYHRRLRPVEEVNALGSVGQLASSPAEQWLAPSGQRSWKAYERIFALISAHDLGQDFTRANYQAWIRRYPQEGPVYSRYFEFLLKEKDYSAAEALIAQYEKSFPDDEVFRVRAKALLEYRRGGVRQGLAVYERSFRPLWPPGLVQNYFDLLRETRSLRAFQDSARAALAADPDDLKALARLFYYYQQQGRLDAAQQLIAEYRLHKEARKAEWSAEELSTLAQWMEAIHIYPEAARYYFALYNVGGTPSPEAQAQALTGLTDILLTAPEQPIRVGAGELSMYQDVATMDPGPGFLNGILSVILNTTTPAYRFSEQERRATPYFHRARAAELLALLDAKFPNASRRAELHSRLIEMYAAYGEDDAVVREGKAFLGAFPAAAERTAVALRMADAYSRRKDSTEEFALYDALLRELAARMRNMPLGEGDTRDFYYRYRAKPPANPGFENMFTGVPAQDNFDSREQADNNSDDTSEAPQQGAFSAQSQQGAAGSQQGPRSAEYAQVLERYLSRLASDKQIATAVAVLRREIDRNPDDPGLYERLARFLEQNQLFAEQEQVYRSAIAQFPDKTWYHKLARWYLRRKREADYEALSKEIVRTFNGSDLQEYVGSVVAGGSLAERVNEYAQRRFPHNLTFVRNLAYSYNNCGTLRCYSPKWVELMRQHWLDDPFLRDWYFRYLSETGKLRTSLAAIMPPASTDKDWAEFAKQNPAAAQFVAEGELWQSHFEDGAPALGAVADLYPADWDLNDRASAVYRSLAWSDERKTDRAVSFEQNLARFIPGSRETMARIGDIYADRERFDQAEPYWRKMAEVERGNPTGYLQAATVYWDYFKFDEAVEMIGKARRQSGNAALYAYEAGAIQEGRHDLPAAILEYVNGALDGNAQGESRLLQLARRPALRDRVHSLTRERASAVDAPTRAVTLFLQVLETQERKDDIKLFLLSAVDRATQLETLEYLEQLAGQRNLDAVKQRALERQAELTGDPVRKLELRYALARFYEQKKELNAAQRQYEVLYSENPKVLGVVRSTVDFFGRNKQEARALDVLQQAAAASYPEMKTRFTFEAVRKATQAKQFALASRLLEPLLAAAPLDGQYQAAMGDLLAAGGDDAGLRDFYLKNIQSLLAAKDLARDVRNERVATLRRGMVPALERMKDFAGGVDQYIEIINKYPEDDALTSEAGLFALRHQQEKRLAEYYEKTVAQSPRDYRWSMVLARLRTLFEDFPAAIEAYGKAIQIRPDRNDLRTARAGLLERLLRFDEAVADFEKLYDLNYKDPAWMLRVAEVRMRQGKTDAATIALRTAVMEGHQERISDYFEMARRLNDWDLLPQARDFAEQGVAKAGTELLADSRYHSGAALYATIMTRLRLQTGAWARLDQAATDAGKIPPSVQLEEAERIRATGDFNRWRAMVITGRTNSADAGLRVALVEMGRTVDRYFVPEEKAEFARFLEGRAADPAHKGSPSLYLQLAEAAVLPGLEARWRLDSAMSRPRDFWSDMNRLSDLQNLRLRDDELGGQLERLAPVAPMSGSARIVRLKAADAYQASGNFAAELRIRAKDEPQSERHLQLVLVATAPDLANQGIPGANFALAHAPNELVFDSIDVTARSESPQWGDAYTALGGLYLADKRPSVDVAFRRLMGTLTVGGQLAKKSDRQGQLVGKDWYYYASRYGVYLGSVTRSPADEDFLAAQLEQSPAHGEAYRDLAEHYADNGQPDKAAEELSHALELSPNQAELRDRYAIMLWRQGRKADAVEQWRQAFTLLERQARSTYHPEDFWQTFVTAVDHLATRKIYVELQTPVENVLRAYLKKSGTYRVQSLILAVVMARGAKNKAGAYVLGLYAEDPEHPDLLWETLDSHWLPAAQKEPLFRKILEIKRDELAKARESYEREYRLSELQDWQVKWVKYLIQQGRFAEAAAGISSSMTSGADDSESLRWLPLDLVIAARSGPAAVDAIIERIAHAGHPPATENLRQVARELNSTYKETATSRKLLEYVYSREISERKLTSEAFLNLAQIELAKGGTQEGMRLLRRMTLVVGEPFEDHEAAANTLANAGKHSEAVVFLEEASRARPWDLRLQVRLAREKIAAANDIEAARDRLARIAAGPSAAYSLRLEAAAALAGSRPNAELGSGELKIIAGAPASFADANKPYYYAARMSVAALAIPYSQKVILLRSALADRPNQQDARLPLFRAALVAGQFQFALAALQPYTTQGAAYRDRSEERGLETREEDWTDSHVTIPGSINQTMPLKDAVPVLMGIAQARERLGQTEQAITHYRLALRLGPSAGQRAEMNARVRELRALRKREELNARRRPVVKKGLDQDVLVRPRLVARSATVSLARKGVPVQ